MLRRNAEIMRARPSSEDERAVMAFVEEAFEETLRQIDADEEAARQRARDATR
jgi:hypothetical protein